MKRRSTSPIRSPSVAAGAVALAVSMSLASAALATGASAAGGAAPVQRAVEQGPDSPACREALARLQALDEAAARRADAASAPAQRESLRRQAARVCLGGEGERSPGVAVPPPPVSAPTAPVTLQRLPEPAAAPAPVVRVPPAPTAPPGVTSCHAGGCWSSDGVFMPRVGSGVLSPSGVCTVLPGGVVQCP